MPLLYLAVLTWLYLLVDSPWAIVIAVIGVIASRFIWHERFWLVFLGLAILAFRAQFEFGIVDFSFHLQWLRELARNLCVGVSPDAQALVLGITSGDDSGLSHTLKAQMQELSLTHLTAVSGTNCSILIAATFWLLAAMGFERRVRVFGSLGVLAIYLLLVGDQPSVWRAAAMAVLVLGAKLRGATNDSIAVLGLSLFSLLLLDPRLAHSMGFALSSLATLGLLVLAPVFYEKLKTKLPKWLALTLAVTVSAQLFCLPVLVTLQPKQNLLAVLANLLAEPVVVTITLLGVMATAIAVVIPGVATLIYWLASWFAQYLVAIASWLAQVDFIEFDFSGHLFGQICLWVFVAAVFVSIRVSKLRKFALVIVSSSLAIFLAFQSAATLQAAGFPIQNWQYVSCDVGQGDATLIRSGGKTALIDVGRDPKLVSRCLNQLQVNKIDLLVLTHFDADHIGGLSAVVGHREISLALVTSYQDPRPGADSVEQMLNRGRVATLKAEKGMTGSLGGFSWRVLSPNHQGLGAENPNDGSIAMLWQSENLSVITLADLGEPAQKAVASEMSAWADSQFRMHPVILKVSHHGSADQFAEFFNRMMPTISTVSVGKNNSYGHPTKSTLELLRKSSVATLRTDQLGSISIAYDVASGLMWSSSRRLVG